MGFNLKSLFPVLAGAGAGAVSNSFSALQPFSAALSAGAGALANRKNPIGGAFQGFAGGGAGAGLAGGIKSAFSSGTGSLFDKFSSGVGSAIKGYGGSIPGFGGIGTSNPTGAFAKMFGGGGAAPGANVRPFTAPSLSSPLSFSTPGSKVANTPAGVGGASVAGSMDPMSMFKNMMPGMAVAGLGSALVPTPKAPDYSGVRNDLMSRFDAAGANNAPALKEYLDTLSAPIGGSAEAGMANARLINDRQKADALKQIQEQFRANNGNLMGNSAYNDAVTKSNAAYDQNYAANAAQLQFEYDNMQKQQKMAAAQALAGLNDTQLQYYATLANLDIQSIQEKFQLDAGRAQALKDIATQAGSLLMEKAVGGAA